MRQFVICLLLFLDSLACYATCQLIVGPELYYFRREREGGTFQEGTVDGIKVTFNRIKSYGWYLGGEYLYAGGCLEGSTATGRPIVSQLIDQIAEGRVGFTFKQPQLDAPYFTIFGGYGYFQERNEFSPPSPLPCTFLESFNYYVIGFLSGIHPTPWFTMGVNLRLRFMQNGKSHVTDDPIYDEVTLLIKDEMHVRLDLPFFISPCCFWHGFGFLFSPFFEYRHFGGREGYPFNYRDTKFYLVGAQLALTYGF
jgi:hypothetical protein